MTKYALIYGANGMDGSYLMELLLEKKYQVYGVIRRASLFNTARIEHIRKKITLFYGDITDPCNIISHIQKIKNKLEDDDIFEIYNLAAQSHVGISFEMPHYTTMTDGVGPLNILEGIRTLDLTKRVKFYQASTSELYGKVQTVPQNEDTPFYPRSPYGCAKLYGFWITKNYRESYDMFTCSGILFNHSSKRRGENFILRKISLGIGKIMRGEDEYIELGNLNAKRDIGHSIDYVRGMYLMLQQDKPKDYVLSTGKQYSIREMVEMAFSIVDIKIKWRGKDINEEGYCEKTGKIYIKINPRYYRPCEVESLLGDASLAKEELNWEPKIKMLDIIKEMVQNDLLK